jgi:plastocyanin
MWKRVASLAVVGLIAGAPLFAGSISGTVKATGLRDSAGAVVYVDAIAGKTFPPPAEHVVMDQKDMAFVPHILPVVVGTTVDFLNSDSFLHNVFTPDKCADKFNLGSWPTGQTKSFTFTKPCVAALLCNVHPEMEAFVVAVPTPYYAVTDKAGAFKISDIPDGTYTVKVWHPKLKEASREVAVAGDVKADFELKK